MRSFLPPALLLVLAVSGDAMCLEVPTMPMWALVDPPLDAYILARKEDGQGVRAVTHSRELRDLDSLRARFGSDFLWFRQGRQTFVIKDIATLDKLRDIFKPEETLNRQEEALDKEEEALDAREEQLEARQEKLDERMEALDDQEEDEDLSADARAKIAKQRQELERDMKDLEREMKKLEADQKQLEGRQRALERQMTQAEKVAEQALERLVGEALKAGSAVRVDTTGTSTKR